MIIGVFHQWCDMGTYYDAGEEPVDLMARGISLFIKVHRTVLTV